jgi:hypothetical protein
MGMNLKNLPDTQRGFSWLGIREVLCGSYPWFSEKVNTQFWRRTMVLRKSQYPILA